MQAAADVQDGAAATWKSPGNVLQMLIHITRIAGQVQQRPLRGRPLDAEFTSTGGPSFQTSASVPACQDCTMSPACSGRFQTRSIGPRRGTATVEGKFCHGTHLATVTPMRVYVPSGELAASRLHATLKGSGQSYCLGQRGRRFSGVQTRRRSC